AVPPPPPRGRTVGRGPRGRAGGGEELMAMLPPEFADLELFAAKWCLPTEPQRLAERMSSTMEEMHAFYDAITQLYDEVVGYVDQFPLHDLSDQQTNLLHLLYSMIQASFPVESWGQPNVPDTGSATFDCILEPVP